MPAGKTTGNGYTPSNKRQGGGSETMAASTVKKLGPKLALADQRRPTVGKPAAKADTLPIVSEFERADMDAAISLMQEDLSLAEQEAAVKAERDLVKKELDAIATKYGTEGMRWGQMATYVNRSEGRRTFDPTLAVEDGIEADRIAGWYKTGKPFTTVKVVDLSKPRKEKGDTDA